ncbi:GTP cyclohydrolase I FolE [Escherichia coli]|nr:GTP cyclohydrolase I FolE [Escherichia coli]
MPSLSKEAALVHEALVARGLETPLRRPCMKWITKRAKALLLVI